MRLPKPEPSVTHVDASKGMVAWAKENAKLSGLSETSRSAGLLMTVQKFVEREIRRGNHYDAIIMDPPSYGRGPKGEIWKIETCHSSIHPVMRETALRQSAVLPCELLHNRTCSRPF